MRSAYRTGCYPVSVVGLLERNAVTALPARAQHLGVHCPGVQGHAEHPRHLSSLHQTYYRIGYGKRDVTTF
jgi:hypothetical protein